jgi:hypothetical protein
VLIRQLDPRQAAAALIGCEGLDPSGMSEAADIPGMCQGGACFEVTQGNAQAVCVVSTKNGVLWVHAAKGGGNADMTAALDEALHELARALGARTIAMQTLRPGLLRKVTGRGWTLAGWIVKREVTQ